jgi:hypothetical protein
MEEVSIGLPSDCESYLKVNNLTTTECRNKIRITESDMICGILMNGANGQWPADREIGAVPIKRFKYCKKIQ